MAARDEDDQYSFTAPRLTAELVGHEAAERQLACAFQAGRLHHGWLIAGPPGIGKATLAYRFARWIFAQGRGDTLAVDPGHPAFRTVANGSHPDLRVLERETNETTGRLRTEISVKQARKIVDFLHHTAVMGGWRIVIVDPVDELGTEAANALLKVLEEPPPRAVFLLVNHALSGALPTIRSRCQRLVLQPLPAADVGRIVARQMPDLPADDVAALVRLAEGSPGRALSMAAAGGIDLLRDIDAVLGRLPQLDGAALERLADKAARGGEKSISALRDLLLWWLADRVKTGAAQGRAAGLDRWARLWENTRRLFERAEAASLDRKQALLEIFYDIQATARAA